MNYTKIYESLTSKNAKSDYTEVHHIVPKCMGGSNDKSNLVRLTAREHYLAHRLLTKIYPKNPSIWHAFACMSRVKRERKYTSLQYEMMKKSRSKAMSMDNPVHKIDREVVLRNIENMTKMNIGDNNIMRRSKELREFHSNRMKNDNPMTKYPERNRTAKPVIVTYEDGTQEHYSYAKKFSEIKNVPYSTVKHIMRKKLSSKKYKIVSIIQEKRG